MNSLVILEGSMNDEQCNSNDDYGTANVQQLTISFVAAAAVIAIRTSYTGPFL